MWSEDKQPNIFERLRRWLSPLIDLLRINPRYVIPLVSLCLGYRVRSERAESSGQWGGHIGLLHDATDSLYYNGILFVRLCLPFGIFVGIRWSGEDPAKREYAQAGLGWKLNGDFAVTLRVQSDQSAARGTTGPNFGQAVGWAEGTK